MRFDDVKLWLDCLPPSVNHAWGQRGKMRFLTAAGKAFREQVAWALRQACGCWPEPMVGELEMYVRLEDSTRRHWDVDNRMKSLLDALQHAGPHGLYENDSQIGRLTIDRRPQPAEVTMTGVWVRKRSIVWPDFSPEERL